VHAARQVFEVDLVHDAEARRHHAEGVEGLHAPLEELVALAVALELQLHVEVERVLRAVVVDHDRVVHHQIHRHQRFDLLRVVPSRCAVLRMAARSASSGTPVKSCSTTRATMNGISSVRGRRAASWPAAPHARA
jgi:hypothetical protein